MLACTFVLPAVSQVQGHFRLVDLGRCVLESGQVIDPCRVGVRTFGQLNDERTNAVLVPMWFTGKTADLPPKVGRGNLLDPTRYYIIAVDPFGNGVSSSPSNSKEQPGERFPRFSIRDMVRTQYRLVRDVLGLTRLHAIVGTSMGAMQAFEWAVSYPEVVKKVVAIVGSPQITSYDLLLWETAVRAIDAGQKCQGCDPLGVYVPLMFLALHTPEYRVRETPKERFADFLKSMTDAWRQDFRPDDLKSQMRAKMVHDVSAPFGGTLENAAKRVTAEMLIIVSSTDHIQRPEPAKRFAALLRARLVDLNSECGHFANDCEAARVAEEVNTFLSAERASLAADKER